MIRVTMELIPMGFGTPKHLGTIEIANTGKGTHTSGDYVFKLFSRGKKPRVFKSGEVKSFPRMRLLGFDLLYRALKEAVGERND